MVYVASCDMQEPVGFELNEVCEKDTFTYASYQKSSQSMHNYTNTCCKNMLHNKYTHMSIARTHKNESKHVCIHEQ